MSRAAKTLILLDFLTPENCGVTRNARLVSHVCVTMSVRCRLRSPLPPNQAIRANQADAPGNIPGVRNAKTPGSLTKGSGIAQSALLVRGVRQRKTPQSADQGVLASGCCRLLGDYLGHRAVVRECPALAYGDIARSGGRLDLAPGAGLAFGYYGACRAKTVQRRFTGCRLVCPRGSLLCAPSAAVYAHHGERTTITLCRLSTRRKQVKNAAIAGRKPK